MISIGSNYNSFTFGVCCFCYYCFCLVYHNFVILFLFCYFVAFVNFIIILSLSLLFKVIQSCGCSSFLAPSPNLNLAAPSSKGECASPMSHCLALTNICLAKTKYISHKYQMYLSQMPKMYLTNNCSQIYADSQL